MATVTSVSETIAVVAVSAHPRAGAKNGPGVRGEVAPEGRAQPAQRCAGEAESEHGLDHQQPRHQRGSAAPHDARGGSQGGDDLLDQAGLRRRHRVAGQ